MHLLLWINVIALTGAIALYYTSGRMRMPIAPPLIALAGAGIAGFMSAATRQRVIALLLLIAAIGIAWGDWFGVRSESMAHADLARMSNAAWHRQKYDQALEFALESEKLSPDNPVLPRLKGQAYYSLGNLPKAAVEFEKSVRLLNDDTSRRNLEVVRDELRAGTSTQK